MANRQHIDLYSGENRTITISGRDSSNAAVNLTGKTIAVYVANRPNDPDNTSAVLTKTGTIVSASAGTFSIAVTPDDTRDMSGDYWYQAKTTDGSGNIAVVADGRFRVVTDYTS